MNDPYGNSDFNLSKSFATDIYVAAKMVFAGGRFLAADSAGLAYGQGTAQIGGVRYEL